MNKTNCNWGYAYAKAQLVLKNHTMPTKFSEYCKNTYQKIDVDIHIYILVSELKQLLHAIYTKFWSCKKKWQNYRKIT